MNAPRIALISAVPAAIAPAEAALRSGFPDAQVWNLLDDRLLSDADTQGGLNDRLGARMRRLIDHAVTEGADGVLLTCSLYGVVAQQMASQASVPVLAPDEAAFEELSNEGYRRILVVASFEAAARDSADRLTAALAGASRARTVEYVVAAAALDATKTGDLSALEAALIGSVAPRVDDFDAVFLAQFSLAPARSALAASVDRPVVSGPTSAAAQLARAVGPTPGE